MAVDCIYCSRWYVGSQASLADHFLNPNEKKPKRALLDSAVANCCPV
jgi:hypothetical protein